MPCAWFLSLGRERVLKLRIHVLKEVGGFFKIAQRKGAHVVVVVVGFGPLA